MNPTTDIATRLRWLIDNHWGDHAFLNDAKELIDNIVGFPRPDAPISALPAPSAMVPSKRHKVAIIVGHNSKATGADAPSPIGLSEFAFNNQVADQMIALSPPGIEFRKFLRQAATSYSAEIRAAYAPVNVWGPDATIELHFNAATPDATGSETLYSGSPASRKLALANQQAMVQTLMLADRGLKEVAAGERGALSLHVAKCPSILVEPFFCTNTGDLVVAHRLGAKGFAAMYIRGLQEYFRAA